MILKTTEQWFERHDLDLTGMTQEECDTFIAEHEAEERKRNTGTARALIAEMEQPAPNCEQCGERFSMAHDCTAGDHHFTHPA